MHSKNAILHLGQKRFVMDWDSYRYFLALCRRKSLKMAARDLFVNQTTVGRRIVLLENEIGAKLFEKRSNGFFLTAAGERVLPLAQEIESHFLAMERQLLGKDQRVSGTIRVAMPGALANHFIIPRMFDFTERYPEVEVQFLTGPEVLNLSRREADLAVRLVRPTQSDLIVRKIGQTELAFYCSRAWRKKWELSKKYPPSPSIPFVGLFDKATSFYECDLLNRSQKSFRTVVRSAAWSSVYSAVKADLGVGVLPSFMGDFDSNLTRFDNLSEKVTLWLVVHPEVVKSARVRVIIEFLSDRLQEIS